VGKKFADIGQARASVNLGDNLIGIKPVLARPPRPDARDHWSRIDQNAIQVEQKRFAGNFRHGKQ
jgi:hypothetical protein